MTRPAALSLSIATPLDVLFTADDIRSFRGRDESGDFGIQPGHADFLTLLSSCVVRWHDTTGKAGYCALRGGLMTVTGGQAIRIACREGVVGGDLVTLETVVAQKRAEDREASSRARVSQTKLHARAVRQIMRRLGGHGTADVDMVLEDLLK